MPGAGRRPGQRRPLASLSDLVLVAVAVVLSLGLLWIVFAVLPPRLVNEVTGKNRADAENAVRTAGIAAFVAIGGIITAVYTVRTFRLTRQSQLTERYTKAVAQLGDDQMEVRIGGIYALERLTDDSPPDQPTIVEVLAAYVRRPPEVEYELQPTDHGRQQGKRPTPGVQAALIVLARRTPHRDERTLDLRHSDLRDAELGGAQFSGANFSGARLQYVQLHDAQLQNASFYSAQLEEASLVRAQLPGANLHGAVLRRAYLQKANLRGATFRDADLSQANLSRADLSQADLSRANLGGAKLADAILTRAKLHGALLLPSALTEEQLQAVEGSEEIRWCRQVGDGRDARYEVLPESDPEHPKSKALKTAASG